MVLQKAFRGLMTVNLRALRFASDPTELLGYLRDLEYAYESRAYPPIRSVDLAEFVGKEARVDTAGGSYGPGGPGTEEAPKTDLRDRNF